MQNQNSPIERLNRISLNVESNRIGFLSKKAHTSDCIQIGWLRADLKRLFLENTVFSLENRP
jgi:hypothetical protein